MIRKYFFIKNCLHHQWKKIVQIHNFQWVRDAKFAIRKETIAGFILPLTYQVPIGCLKFIMTIILSLIFEFMDLFFDALFYYKLGNGDLLDGRICVSDSVKFCIWLFTIFGALKLSVNVLLRLKIISEVETLKTWQISNEEITLGASSMIGIFDKLLHNFKHRFFHFCRFKRLVCN